MVATAFEPVALDCVRDLDARVNPFIGYALEGFIVTSYLQWRAKGETVYVMPHGSLLSHYGGIALAIYPIPADFKVGRFHLHTLAHFNYHQEHSHYLIVLNGGDYIEIGLFADNTLLCVLDFNMSSTFGA